MNHSHFIHNKIIYVTIIIIIIKIYIMQEYLLKWIYCSISLQEIEQDFIVYILLLLF
jgi:hypothetical protein